MNARRWMDWFESNRLNRPEPEWHVPCPTDAPTRAALARSLAHFQLGESGDGRHLLAAARKTWPDDAAYLAALETFLGEEHAHAALLARLVERHGGALVRRHWSHTVFRLVRQALGARFELQVLATAEIVGTAYYRIIHRRTRDPVLEQACSLILRDEAGHLAFHRDRFGSEQADWLPLARGVWLTQFQALLVTVAAAAWLDHRRALAALGARRREWVLDVNREAAAFLGGIAARAAELTAARGRIALPGEHPSSPASPSAQGASYTSTSATPVAPPAPRTITV